MCLPTVSDERRSGVKSGWCAMSTGVGTATTMNSASASALGSVLISSIVAALRSAEDTSPVGSTPRLYASTFAWERSKPMVRNFLPNSTASGRPT